MLARRVVFDKKGEGNCAVCMMKSVCACENERKQRQEGHHG